MSQFVANVILKERVYYMNKIRLTNDQWYDFKNGWVIGDTEIEEWVNEVLNDLLEDKEDFSSSFRASGNACVWGFKWGEKIEIGYTRGYQNITLLKENGRWVF